MAPAARTAPDPTRRRLFGATVLLVLLLGAVPLRADGAAALLAVEGFRDRMAGIAPGIPAERLSATAAVVDEFLALPAMVRNAVGTLRFDGWTEEERATVLEAFRRYSAAVLAERSGDTRFGALLLLGTRSGPGGSVIVDGRLDGDDLSFVVVQENGAWLLMDVVREGVSELALRRAEFSAAAGEGALVLAERLDERTTALEEALP